MGWGTYLSEGEQHALHPQARRPLRGREQGVDLVDDEHRPRAAAAAAAHRPQRLLDAAPHVVEPPAAEHRRAAGLEGRRREEGAEPVDQDEAPRAREGVEVQALLVVS